MLAGDPEGAGADGEKVGTADEAAGEGDRTLEVGLGTEGRRRLGDARVLDRSIGSTQRRCDLGSAEVEREDPAAAVTATDAQTGRAQWIPSPAVYLIGN